MSEAWSIIASSLRFPVCDGHTASACLVSFWFFFLLLFFYLPFVCWGSVIIYRQGEGEGGRKAEGSSEDFCVTITFTLRLCNFLLTPLPPAPPPQSLAFNWQSISDIPLLYYVNDHPPPPENNVISPLKSSKPLPSPPPQVINKDWLVPHASRGIFLADENGFITRMKVFELNYSK